MLFRVLRSVRSVLSFVGLAVCVARCTTAEQPSGLGGDQAAGEPASEAGAAAGVEEGGRGSVSAGARSGQAGDELSGIGGQPAGAGGGSAAPDAGGAAGQPAREQPSGGAGPVELVCHDGGLGEGSTCRSFCTAWFPICLDNASTSTVFEDEADCLAQCAELSEEQLCCRGYHVTNAPDEPTSHCPHAAGIRNCP